MHLPSHLGRPPRRASRAPLSCLGAGHRYIAGAPAVAVAFGLVPPGPPLALAGQHRARHDALLVDDGRVGRDLQLGPVLHEHAVLEDGDEQVVLRVALALGERLVRCAVLDQLELPLLGRLACGGTGRRGAGSSKIMWASRGRGATAPSCHAAEAARGVRAPSRLGSHQARGPGPTGQLGRRGRSACARPGPALLPPAARCPCR